MIRAYHMTTQEAFYQIKAEGYIKPLCRLRQSGEAGYGFKPDWVAGDTEYIFFSVSDFYMNLGHTGEDETFGFVFDAYDLVYDFGGIVGEDLVHEYDKLLHKTAKEIDLTLKAKPVDDAAVQEFCERMEISDPRIIESIQKDEASHYYDLLDGMLNRDESVPGVSAALQLFDKRAALLRACRRFAGDEGWQLLKNASALMEILVKKEVPIAHAHSEIINGKEQKKAC